MTGIIQGVAAAVSIASGAKGLFGGKQKSDPAVAAAQKRSEELQAQQKASTLRLQQQTDKQETDLSAQAASRRRAAAANARGRGGLGFTGPQLKTKLGG